MAATTPPLAHASDTDYSGSLRGLTIFFIVLAVIAGVSRVLARRFSRLPIKPDDVFSFIGLLASIALFITVLIKADINVVSHRKPSKGETIIAARNSIATGTLYTISILTIKLSLLFLYRRIFTMNVTWFRVCWWLLLIFLFPLWTTTAFTLLGVQAAHPNAFANDNKLSNIGTPAIGFSNAATDVLILILPIKSTLHLQMPRKHKIALIGIFAIGSLGCATSILRASSFLQERDEHWDPVYAEYHDLLTSEAEVLASLICTSLPIIRPFLVKTREVVVSFGSSVQSLLTHKGSRGDDFPLRSRPSRSFSNEDNSQKGIQKSFEYEINAQPTVYQTSFYVDSRKNNGQSDA